ncbi:hypothetical protein JAB1_46590 [Janthinobacterium sp. MP5059B]|nr:hypothetical protein JAB1_46590 [Janthinobacterium sp. MP5059B]
MTICPYCDQQIGSLTIQTPTGYAAGGSWKCITLNCPKCHKVLSAQIDPIAIKTDTINAIKQR